MDSLAFILLQTQSTATNIYAIITPFALAFMMLEIGLCWYYKKDLITFQESIANFGTALGNQTTNVLVAAGVYVVYGYLWDNFRIIDQIPMNWFTYLLLFLGVDFIFYWVHRWGHHINIMWAAHSPHHSAEEMNFFVALRASVTQRLFSFFFFFPLTIIGFKPVDIYMITGIHLFQAFLHHTELIRKLWWGIEAIFTTPSHHRVHHGVNFKYLDKNFGEFLIIWDRLFGTFQEESEKVVYGMYNHPQSWNPININFHYYKILWKDAVAAPYIWDKFKLWFMPLGWLPRGLPPKPALIETTPDNQVKFQTKMFPQSKIYLIIHAILGIFLMMMVIKSDSPWNTQERWIGAFLLWYQIINWSGILESRSWLFMAEIIRIPLTLFCVLWFSEFSNPVIYSLVAVSVVSLYWTFKNFRTHQEDALVLN
ncbi:MAG: sterol desaturase family protein [Arcicella sp.]|jgi:sterol desaturase/sphingolipid hydroxylase (fatty acid hydroxylase superfamily)|nr:sterol desaturase family protein [Arcicella sp.]